MVKKKEDNSKKNNTNDFNFSIALQKIEPPCLKDGFEYHVNAQNIKIEDNLTFDKEFKKYLKGV